ncbi:M15 family metallopeptidase [Nocardioides sp. AE5]|uniref:M15 family metallopeptidase n=1 Tax=Nocardioides sp. AE5 TaxID=2962573 RepID=UPI002882B2E9|nr:M15 family metallopeptidase [Nocardioides sp. AE5]MDT0201831.1 M15 family metallopeptidase [Nocardioides sp. AE5]
MHSGKAWILVRWLVAVVASLVVVMVTVPATADEPADPSPPVSDQSEPEPGEPGPGEPEPGEPEPSGPEPQPSEPEPTVPEPTEVPVEPAPSADQVATSLTLTASRGRSGRLTALTATLTDAASAPVAGAAVTIQRRQAGAWTDVDSATTDGDGTVTVKDALGRSDEENAFRARFAGNAERLGSTSGEVVPELVAWRSFISLIMPRTVRDESYIDLTVYWRDSMAQPIDGPLVQIQRKSGNAWVTVRTMASGSDGRSTWSVMIRSDSQWRAIAVGADWVEGATSTVRTLDNQPPRAPVSLSSSAPKPTVRVPAQPRSTVSGPNVVITTIPDSVWAEMNGVTWTSGCPVGRSDLRLVRMNYWAFDGYRRRGEIVVHKDIATKTGKAFTSLYKRRIPIRSMYRVDRFGYNASLRGGDDHKSMAADNTSAFNCRRVVGNPNAISPHAYGKAIDINPWENPYRSSQGYTPNTWWPSRSHAEVAWRNSRHIVVHMMKYYGFRWTYGAGDLHHFDG